MEKKKILFVCLGNICRSPAAEGALYHILAERGLQDQFEVDSCGTAGYHTGELPDRRTRQVARSYGIDLTHRARQFRSRDFQDFDLILAMDRSNLADLQALARSPQDRARLKLFRSYDPEANGPHPEVPDPYYGSLEDFEAVQEMCLRSARALVDELIRQP